MTNTTVERRAFADVVAALGCGLGLLLGVALAAGARDSAMSFHGALLALACAVGLVFVLRDSFGEESKSLVDEQGYFDGPVKVATIAAVFWGIAGFAVGDFIAWQMAFPALNFDLPWTSFGRMRPLHTSAVIFAFGGNALIATSFYVVQRTCHARLAGRWAPYFVVWGYQLFIVIAATGYLLGVTQSKEYAEP